MSNQNFEVIFNIDPTTRPVGLIDGFRQSGNSELILPEQMVDVLDDSTSIKIGENEYVINQDGSVIGAKQAEQLDRIQMLKDVPLNIGNGVFIGPLVEFTDYFMQNGQGFEIGQGSAIGHQFPRNKDLKVDDRYELFGQLPSELADRSEEIIENSVGPEPRAVLAVASGFKLGEYATVWGFGNFNTPIREKVVIGDGSQIFAWGIGENTTVEKEVIVEPTRGLIGADYILGKTSIRSAARSGRRR